MSDENIFQIAAEFRSAVFLLRRRLRNERAIADLSDTALAVLNQLTEAGPQTPSVLAAREYVSGPSMSRILRQLEGASRIRRITDPVDGRKVRIEITDSGAKLMADTKEARDAWLEEELTSLEPLELAAVRRVSELMVEFARR